MSTKRYPEEFKIEAIKQVTERGHTVADVASRLGVSTHSLYKWIREADQPAEVADQFEARLLWMHEHAMTPGRQYLLKLASKEVTATVTDIK